MDIRIVIAALIVKHKLRPDDRGTVEMIQENIYIQYFCGFKSFTRKAFNPSLFVAIRKRPGGDEFDSFNKAVIERAEQLKPHQLHIKSNDTDKDDKGVGTSSKPWVRPMVRGKDKNKTANQLHKLLPGQY